VFWLVGRQICLFYGSPRHLAPAEVDI